MIVKKSLADEVSSAIQEQIASGYYIVGTKLPIEPELMKSFGVGRSTIREAIKLLANTGLVKVKQGVGTFIEEADSNKEPMDQKLKRAKMQDLDEVRNLLEIKIAEKAALNRTEEDIIKLKGFLKDRQTGYDNGSLVECVEADILFHIAIAEASKNEILADLYKSVAIHLKERFLDLTPSLQSFKDTNEVHEQILQSIIDGDLKDARNSAEQLLHYNSNNNIY